ncbi:thrombospondin type 3 repeat-containing protein [Antarcticibacterium sp. 1MA-6-2]|uniref:thrombospondin type 3 repeat-containing protein n=1 Tax=Antarcticibacterium sp. 1MA-6-2 TaxID=2908210 RepID=UPI001F1952EC|nr:thrombospondin type 3 repeat-containing protein [Antarcticibacterium sp. 1MA-6-2]UJH91268.1 thrombospondin type 3 repeat-containing protein [Antarcticibacterium sp. 1MA-6-2]
MKPSVLNSDPEKATVSFGAIVNDLVTNRAASKQSMGDLPDCSDDTPAYVRIVLMQGDEEVVGTSTSPHRVDLVAGEIFTVEDAELELEPGNYTLEHFSVYNSDDEVIWLAPRTGSDLGAYVNATLPIAIDLRAGVKKYVDVPVLCFDNREVNQYGYLFFELDTNVALTYCFFANYCNDDGMHYPARYSISIWSGNNANGVAIYTNETNFTGQHNNGDYYATPLCLALPDNDDLDEEYLYYEMTLLDWDDNYGDVEQVMMSGTITKREILANFGDSEEDNVEYEHVRFCDDAGELVGDRDNDNIPDNMDECPDEVGPASNNGCPEENDGDLDGDGVPDSIDLCPNTPAGTDVDSDGCPEETDGDADGDGVPDSIDLCPNTPSGTDVDATGCPEDTTGEGCTGLPAVCDIEFGSLPEDCYVTVLDGADGNGYVRVNSAADIDLMQTLVNEAYGTVSVSASGNSVTVSIDGGLPQDRVTAYEVEVRPGENGAMSATCWESQCASTVTEVPSGDQPALDITFDDLEYSYPFYVRVNAVICESVVGE